MKRSIGKLREIMKDNMHLSLKEQVKRINQVLRGHYNYYGIAGNTKAIGRIYRFTEKYWKTILGKRCWKGTITWDKYSLLLREFPILKPRLAITYEKWSEYAML